MNKGFTLVETLVSAALVLLTILFSARVMLFALEQSRKSALRFRLVEKLDYYQNYLSSLSFSASELAAGEHREENAGFTVRWRVEAAAPYLKKINLTVAVPSYALPLFFYKSKYIQEVIHD
jgi:type II secretory pathway component PulJ